MHKISSNIILENGFICNVKGHQSTGQYSVTNPDSSFSDKKILGIYIFETSQNFMNSRIKPWLVIWESTTAVSALCPVKRTRMRVKWLRLKPGRRGCEK